jgi:hypothetical protein
MTVPTSQMMSRLVSDWKALAGEDVSIEHIEGTLYCFCSELGALRLHYKLTVGRVGYSQNLKTWFYALELPQYES